MIALFRVPLAAGYPANGELLAANVLVVTQVIAASLLFPLLLTSGPAAVAVISAAWPFLVLAGVLSGAPPERIAAAGCYVSAWLVALWTWGEVGNGSALRAVAVASLLTLLAIATLVLQAVVGRQRA